MTIWIKEFINFKECAARLKPIFPDHSQAEIEAGLSKCFWADERSEYWVNNEKEAEEEIEEILVDFIAEEANESRQTARVVLATQWEPKPGKFSPYHPAGMWI